MSMHHLTLPEFVRRTDLAGVLPCAEPGVDADELFFNQSGAGVADEALLLCSRCPVAQECRSFARERKEWGLWGGEPESARATPRRSTSRIRDAR